jgi:archaellum component FlaC
LIGLSDKERQKSYAAATVPTANNLILPIPASPASPPFISRRPVENSGNGGPPRLVGPPGSREDHLDEEVAQNSELTKVNTVDYQKLYNEHQKLRFELERVRKEHEGCGERYLSSQTNFQESEKDNEVLTETLREVRRQYTAEKGQWAQSTNSQNTSKQQIRELKDQVKDLKNQLETAESNRNVYYNFYSQEMSKTEDLNRQITELLDKNHIAIKAFTDVQAEYERAKEDYRELHQLHTEAILKVARLTDNAGTMLDDKSFERKWRNLQSSISYWASVFFVGPEKKLWGLLKHPEAQAPCDNELLKLSNDCQDMCLKSEDGTGRALIAEAYLWSYLEENVFDARTDTYSKGMLWAHNARADLCRMEKFLRPGKSSTCMLSLTH